MPKVLIVEDDADIADLMSYTLRRAGYETDHVLTGPDALSRARARTSPDAIVLDLMLPGIDGLQVCRTLRSESATAAIPIIMVTAKGDEADRVAGLDIGADDYLTKPFSPRELVARVRALLRRTAIAQPEASTLRYRNIVLDRDRHEVTVDGAAVRLTAKEFLMLAYLIERKGRLVSRDQLLTDVWGYQYTGGTRTVDVHIRRLREKIPALEQAIETVKQFGYKLAE